jgi:hypothetical protein
LVQLAYDYGLDVCKYVLTESIPFVDRASPWRDSITLSIGFGAVVVDTALALFGIEETHRMNAGIKRIHFVDEHYLHMQLY